jgi:NADH:ubiquinone oxidoreductase subunit 5 (subunit L)/multisubunit Na+/H+ antiporter MnhA subunit
MTFNGEFKGGADAEPHGDSHGGVHLGESPATMVLPLVILSVPAILAGILVNSVFFDIGTIPAHWLSHFLDGGPVHVETEPFNFVLAIVSTIAALVGIALAYLMYQTKTISSESIGAMFKPLYVLFSRKYFMDELYENVLVSKVFYGGLDRALDWFDRSFVDRIANFIGWVGTNSGSVIRQVQTGQLQGYGIVISLGVLVIFGVFLFMR